MSSNVLPPTVVRHRKPGLSLVEIGMVLVIISLALAPVVQMVAGPTSKTGEGNATRMNAIRSKEAVLANTIVERVIATGGDVMNCTGTAPITLPTGGGALNYPAAGACTNNTYNKPIYYRWTIQDMSTAGNGVPDGNSYYRATLNVYDSYPGTPIVTFSTYFYKTGTYSATASSVTGIMIVQDISGSMVWSQVDGALTRGGSGTASPYLKYPYNDPSVGYVVNPSLNMDAVANGGNGNGVIDDDELDIVSANPVNDPDTFWDDRYPRPGIHGMVNCDGSPPNPNWNAALWNTHFVFNDNTDRNHINQLCSTTAGNRDAVLNSSLSRMEASRASLLSFLVSIEQDPVMLGNTKLGFVTFETGMQTRVGGAGLETPTGGKFTLMRNRLTWMNRQGPGSILTGGGTNMYGGVDRGADLLCRDRTLQNRIVFLVGDGQPTVGNTSHASFQSLADNLASGNYCATHGGSTQDKITVFTLGLLAPQASIEPYMKTDLADRTPGGAFFYTNNVANIQTVFEQVKYQIFRVAILNSDDRYNYN